MSQHHVLAACSALCLLLATGCGGGTTPSPAPGGSETTAPEAGTDATATSGGEGADEELPAAAVAEARTIFKQRCAPCHGQTGRGDGPASAGLTPPPRDLSEEDWQESVTGEYIEKIVLYGGAAVGKSPAMPPNPDLNGKPQVVDALRAHVRSLAAQ